MPRSTLRARSCYRPLVTPTVGAIVLFVQLLGISAVPSKASAQDLVRVSVKHILTPAGVRANGQYSSDSTVMTAIADCNTVLQNNGANWRLDLVEILDVCGSPFHTISISQAHTLEAAAILDVTTYHWRGDAINIYVVPHLTDAGGICSQPGSHEIIVLDNGSILNGHLAWLHEIGHYLSLTHTFQQTSPLACPVGTNACVPTQGAIHAAGALVACPDICPDTHNLMSYNCVNKNNAVLTPCQLQETDFELSPAGSRGHVANLCPVRNLDCTLNCMGSVVDLNWDASAGLLVDVYRDNLLLATTSQTSWSDSPGPGSIEYRVVASMGCEATCMVNIDDGQSELIFRLGAHCSCYDSAGRMEATLRAAGYNVLVSDDLSDFACPQPGQRIWVFAGSAHHARALSFGEGQILRDAILGGVNVYVEGADVWGFDPHTPFHDYDGVDPQSLHGDDTFQSMVGFDHASARLAGMDAVYVQAGGIVNDRNDQLLPAAESGGPNSGVIWRNSGANAYATGIFYDTLPQFGNVLCQSWEFGGYGGSRPELAARYVTALGGEMGQRAFEISGTALGIPYEFGFGGATDPTPYTITGLSHGANPPSIAAAFVQGINGLATAATATMHPTNNRRFLLEAPTTFEFWVSTVGATPCQVTDNPTGCSFNPLIIEVAPPVIPRFSRGDTNGDGSVNVADAITLLGYLFPSSSGPNSIPCLDSADADDAGGVNLADAIAILSALFGTPPIPLAPPVQCGEDPTPDQVTCNDDSACP